MGLGVRVSTFRKLCFVSGFRPGLLVFVELWAYGIQASFWQGAVGIVSGRQDRDSDPMCNNEYPLVALL